MGDRKKKTIDEYKLQHNTFFEETFGMPSLGVAFLRKVLPKEPLKQIDVEKLTAEKGKIP